MYDYLNRKPTNGRVALSLDPAGHLTRYGYTAQGQLKTLTDPEGHITRLDYNPQGDLIKLTDALGHTTQLTPDSVGGSTQFNYTPARDLSIVVMGEKLILKGTRARTN